MKLQSKIIYLFALGLSLGFVALFSSVIKPSSVCAAQWGNCATGDRRFCPSNGEQIDACIDSVDIVGYVYDTVNVPDGTRVTMYIGQESNSCSDVTCLLRNDSGSTTWNGSLRTIDISTIGCSGGACRVDGRDWIDVTFTISKSGWSDNGCRAEMSARDGGSWFQALNESEMRGRMDITGNNNFSREINVKFVCPAILQPTPTPTNTPIPTPTPTRIPTPTPTIPTATRAPTPTLPPGVTPPPAPTPTITPTPTVAPSPSACPVPSQVVNVKITCPNCATP